MHLYLNKETGLVEADISTPKDLECINGFPGFFYSRKTSSYCARPKPSVIFNLVSRLKAAGHRVTLSGDVFPLYQGKIKLETIPESFRFFTKPLRHQEIALRFLLTNQGGGLLLDPGLGKTKVVLDYADLCEFKRVLVICPVPLIFVWEDEVATHRPTRKIYHPESITWDKKIASRQEALATCPEDDKDTRLKLEREIRYLMEDRERDLLNMGQADLITVGYSQASEGTEVLQGWKPDLIAVDEALVKNPSSNRTCAIDELVRTTEAQVILMSGTLINNSPLDAYSPVHIMEPSLVGDSFFKFKERYCIFNMSKKEMAKKEKKTGRKVKRFGVGFRDDEEVRGILRTCSVVMRKEDWLDLPPKQFFMIDVEIPRYIQKAYEELEKNSITFLQGEKIEVDNPLTRDCKLKQLCNGFVYLSGDDSAYDLFNFEEKEKKNAERETLFLPEQPKAEAMISLLQGKLAGRKVLVWYTMTAEKEVICKYLKEAGFRYAVVSGKEKNASDNIRRFNNTQELDVLVCQSQSVNYGVTILGTTPEKLEKETGLVLPDVSTKVYTSIFYSIGFSLERFIQQQDRNHRIGLTMSPEYYLLTAVMPIEKHTHECMKDKVDTREFFLQRGVIFPEEVTHGNTEDSAQPDTDS